MGTKFNLLVIFYIHSNLNTFNEMYILLQINPDGEGFLQTYMSTQRLRLKTQLKFYLSVPVNASL